MNDDVKKGRGRVVLLAAAALLAIGLVWVFYGGVSDKEGRIIVSLAMVKAREAQQAVAAYYAERKALPPDNAALRLPGKDTRPYLTALEQEAKLSFEMLVQSGVLTFTFASEQDPVSGKTLIFVPRIVGGTLEWSCRSGTVDARYRPPQCRSQ